MMEVYQATNAAAERLMINRACRISSATRCRTARAARAAAWTETVDQGLAARRGEPRDVGKQGLRRAPLLEKIPGAAEPLFGGSFPETEGDGRGEGRKAREGKDENSGPAMKHTVF